METGAWPSSVLRDPGGGGREGVGGGGGECFLPLEVDGAWFSFKAYYLSLYSGRRLVFTPHLGTAEVSIHIGEKDFTATMPTFAMCVLLLFEQTNSLTFLDVLSMTNIPPKALKYTLKALITPVPLPSKKGAKKMRGPPLLLISNSENENNSNLPNTNIISTNTSPDTITNGQSPTKKQKNNSAILTTTTTTTTTTSTSTSTTPTISDSNNKKQNNENEEIADNAIISLNLDFGAKCTAKRFKIASSGLFANNQQTTNTEVEDGQKKKREWQVDCIVVRVMKTRRRLQHTTLMQEVIAQSASHFIPTIALIKLRIQALIEREFIARDSADRSTYIYLE